MSALRLVVLAVTLVATAVAPLLWGPSRQFAAAEPAHASTATSWQDGGSTVRQANENDDEDEDNDDADDDDEDNDNADDDGEDNDNADDDGEDNDNADDEDDDADDDAEDNDNADEVATGGESAGAAGGGMVGDVVPAVRCYDPGAVGAIDLHLAGGGVTLDVVPVSSFQQASEVSLRAVDPASVPATPGALLEDFIFDVQALNGCDGPALGELPSPVNLGIAYAVPADRSSLQIAYWDGASWVDVQTVPDPDPSNPYISATIQRAGTYAVYQE